VEPRTEFDLLGRYHRERVVGVEADEVVPGVDGLIPPVAPREILGLNPNTLRGRMKKLSIRFGRDHRN
jgi:hypothetical protein